MRFWSPPTSLLPSGTVITRKYTSWLCCLYACPSSLFKTTTRVLHVKHNSFCVISGYKPLQGSQCTWSKIQHAASTRRDWCLLFPAFSDLDPSHPPRCWFSRGHTVAAALKHAKPASSMGSLPLCSLTCPLLPRELQDSLPFSFRLDLWASGNSPECPSATTLNKMSFCKTFLGHLSSPTFLLIFIF